MEVIKKYQEIAKEVLGSIYDRYAKSSDEVNNKLVLDDDSRNYLLLTDGWIGESRFYGILIHIEVKSNGRVWLHDDNTDLIVVDYLLERGIPKNQIVLGWHTPSMREDTAFAPS